MELEAIGSVRPPPIFVADHSALDFLNTVAAPWGDEIEWLASGRDLLEWLQQVDAAPIENLSAYRALARSGELDEVAAKARRLREWLRDFVARRAGQPLRADALGELSRINRLLAGDAAYGRVAAAKPDDRDAISPLRLEPRRHWRGRAEDLLIPIAGAIADLVCTADFRLVRQCEGAGCSLWFLDVSKAHARRWCSMAVCGNRAKATKHRARTKRRQFGEAV